MVEARLAELKNHESSAAGLIDGGSAELAAANIQKPGQGADRKRKPGQIRSAQNLPPQTEGGFQRIDIQYDVSIPDDPAEKHRLSHRDRHALSFLGGIDLHAPESWESYGVLSDPPNLDVRWTVRAYRWMGAR
ncbi:MAG: hypothetical protein WDM81_08610 [Rhizomicrobium sp.]